MTQALWLGLAAWAAFAVATALGIQHAFWASMPVWVVAQPWRGVVFERALWRLFGTLAGGFVGMALLEVSPTPWITAFAMALLLALAALLMHAWQGVRSYIPLMSGITVAVVVVPAMMDPAVGMELALDRLACTLIGGLSVTLIVGVFTPKAQSRAFYDEVRAFAESAVTETKATLHGRPGDAEQLLHRAGELETRARLIAAGSRGGYRQMAAVDAVLAAGISLLEAGDALAAEGPEAAATALDAMAGSQREAERGALRRLLAARDGLSRALDALDADMPPPRDGAVSRLRAPGNMRRGLAVAMLAFAASLCGSTAIILTNSFSVELAAFSMAIFALVIGSMPLPHVLAPKVAAGVVIGVAVGTIYRIGVQPHVVGWAMLVLTIAPFIAVGALARVNPGTAVYALDANMCFMLASQAGALPHPWQSVVVDAVFMALGTVLIVLCYMLLPRPSRKLVGVTADRLWRDIDLLSRRPPMAPESWNAIAGRRILTLAIELDKTGEIIPRGILSLSSLGHALNDLRALAMSKGKLATCDAWLAGLVAGNVREIPFDGQLAAAAGELARIRTWAKARCPGLP